MASTLRRIEAKAYRENYRPAAFPARNDIRHLATLTRRYQRLVRATVQQAQEISRAHTCESPFEQG